MRRPRRRWNPLRNRFAAVLLASVVVGLVRYWPADVPDRVEGPARIIDGDSLRVAGEEIRLVGIDAPERQQTCERNGQSWACGKAASRALRALLAQRNVECNVEGLDKYDRLLAVCWRRDVSINAWMVEQGWAISYGDYRSQEKLAEKARRGIWSGTFDQPQDWRAEHLSGTVAAASS